jgi:pseudo-rSAM protein
MPSANRDNSFWLYLESWVQVTAGSGKVLFYNTLNKKSLRYNHNQAATRLAKSFIDPENGYVVCVNQNEISGTPLGSIIKDLQNLYMGDLLDTKWSEGKPVNILPKPFIKNKLTRNVFDNPDDLSMVNYDDYLHEVTLYLNTGSVGIAQDYPLGFRQFLLPGIPGKNEELNLDILTRLSVELSVFKLLTINFTGSNVFNHSYFQQIFPLFRDFNCDKKFHLSLADFSQDRIIELSSYQQVSFAAYITFPLDTARFNEMIGIIAGNARLSRFEFHFVIKNDEELKASLEVIEVANISNYFFKPYYDGSNFSFFRDNVFITQGDVDKSKPDQHQVFSRLIFNEKDFGKFIFVPGGKVFANMNDPKVGTFPEMSVVDLIIKETLYGKSWKRTRRDQVPCKRCVNNFLCPPVSSYEILMKRYNFCDIFETPGQQ